MGKPKVLFTSHTANFQKFNRPFMRMLREQGAEVHYASMGEEKILDCDQSFTVPFTRSPFKLSNVKAYRQLKEIIGREVESEDAPRVAEDAPAPSVAAEAEPPAAEPSSQPEAPQLFNVLKGDMSFVGPRPLILKEKSVIDLREKLNANSVRPDITGWAQANGRDEIDDVEKAELDGYYVENFGIKMDIHCILKTIWVIVSVAGHSEGHECAAKNNDRAPVGE